MVRTLNTAIHFLSQPRVIAVVLIALSARLALFFYLLWYGGEPLLFAGDSLKYVSLADNSLSGNGYSYEGLVESFRAPGYPAYFMFFRVFGIPLWVASIVQLVISALIAAWAVWFSERFLGLSSQASAAVGAFVAIEPVQVYYGVILLPDVFFSVAALAAFTYVLRSMETGMVRHAAYAGIAIGLGNFVRPAMLYLALFVAVLYVAYAWWHKTSLRRALFLAVVVAVASYAVMSPWYVRNYVVFGRAEFVSAKDYTMYAYVAAATKAAAEGRTYESVKQELLARAQEEAPSSKRETSENSLYYSERSREILTANPGAFLKVYSVGLAAFWTSGNYQYLLKSTGLLDRPTESVSYSMLLVSEGFTVAVKEFLTRISEPFILVALFDRILWLSILVLSCVGILLYRTTAAAWVITLYYVYFSATILSTVVGVEARHRYALIPIMIACACVAVASMWNYVKRLRSF